MVKKQKTIYEIQASLSGVDIRLSPDFWNEEILDNRGLTRLDINILALCQEIKNGLYWVSIAERPKA